VNVVCQLPSCGGKSRHGAPVRMIHNTASKNSRLSFAVTPRSQAFPESNGSSFAHCESFNSFRTTSSAPRNQPDNLYIPCSKLVQALNC
jgi:hypothetical protein